MGSRVPHSRRLPCDALLIIWLLWIIVLCVTCDALAGDPFIGLGANGAVAMLIVAGVVLALASVIRWSSDGRLVEPPLLAGLRDGTWAPRQRMALGALAVLMAPTTVWVGAFVAESGTDLLVILAIPVTLAAAALERRWLAVALLPVTAATWLWGAAEIATALTIVVTVPAALGASIGPALRWASGAHGSAR